MLYKSYSPEETEKIATELAKEIEPGTVLCLDGELGVGKTAMTKAICKALGVTENVYSPTYTIINRYDGKFPIYHIDAYRIEDVDEMYEIGFDDCLAEGVCIIEWSSVISDILPQQRIEIKISRDINIDENYREITVNSTIN